MAHRIGSCMLAADVGGTKTHIALFDARGGRLRMLRQESFASRASRGVESIVGQFLERRTDWHAQRACVGVAGPVVRGVCRTPNLPWVVDQRRIADLLDAPVTLINDLEALGHGIAGLSPRSLLTLHAGRAQAGGNRALIAAGTGLGETILCADQTGYHPLPSEGGHADFAPRNALEMELLRSLWREHAHVSYERLVSGPGLVRIYRFLRQRSRRPEPSWLTAALRHRDAAAVISQEGLSRRDACCRQALELFVSLYGAEAGNLAMKALATGGLYVGGGIAPKILPLVRRGGFMRAFLDKGRMRGLLSQMPVRVILNDQTALLGAARYAWLQEQGDVSSLQDAVHEMKRPLFTHVKGQ